jgi:hypothetical protein
MNTKHRINQLERDVWQKCKRVRVEGDTILWELESRPYDLFEAYAKAPHRELINSKDDSSLVSFVKNWGPLRERLDSKSGTDPLEAYRTIRDRLAWKAEILLSVEHPERRRAALADFDRVNQLRYPYELVLPGTLPHADDHHSGRPPHDSIPSEWLQKARSSEVENLCIKLATSLTYSYFPTHQVVRKGRKLSVQSSFRVHDLIASLDWMLWQDIYNQRPFLRCANCENLIPFTSRREKKFCSSDCARRKTAREWQRRKRGKERPTNGTQEAR